MKINRIFVVGAGLMGSGIAQVMAQSGYTVVLNDVNADALHRAGESIAARWNAGAAKGKITVQEQQAYMSRLSTADSLEQAHSCDLIIEAVYESVEAKSAILRALSERCRGDAIIASNTSSISITTLASFVEHKGRFVGMHFFSPVPVMPLLEVIPGLCTSRETLAAVREVGETLHKNVIVAKDKPGFIVNRMLDLMLNEAVLLLDEGTGSVEDIDTGMKSGCKHPMGPLELIDMAGADILLAVMETFYQQLGDPKYCPCLLLHKMVRSGFLGRKTGIGFYVYDGDGKRTGVNPVFTVPCHENMHTEGERV